MSAVAFGIALLTGCIVWVAILLVLLTATVFVGIPAFWRWICWCGYCAFADAEEKREVRRLALRAAQGHPQ